MMGHFLDKLQHANVSHSTKEVVAFFFLAAICEEVPSIQNGQVTVSGTRPGAIATYRCNSGFRLIGQRTRVCEIDGTFSGQAPTCQRKIAYIHAYNYCAALPTQ